MKKTTNLLLKKRDQRGFTLIELLVVVAIIGILMAIGVSNYLQYRSEGADQAELADAANFLTLAMADVTVDTGDTFDNANLPPGFVQSTDVTISGGITLDNAGAITATDINFEHIGGTALDATIADDGNGNAEVAQQ